MSKLLGGILQAVGILIAGASGLCSLTMIAIDRGTLVDLPAVAVIGGVPFVIGLALFRWGRSIVRRADDWQDRYQP